MSDSLDGSGSHEAIDDTLATLSADLRALRLKAGNPTLSALAHQTGISKTVLSEAFAGRRLPSARTVDGIVDACGGESAAWVARRDRLAAAQNGRAAASTLDAAPTTDAPVGTAVPAPTRGRGREPRRVRLSVAIAAAFTCLILGVAGTVGTLELLQPRGQGASAAAPTDSATPGTHGASAPRIAVKTGSDPAFTECVDDAAVAAAETRAENTLLEIIWSDACQAGWARITRYDGLAAGNVVSASIYRQLAPGADDRQSTSEPEAQGAYTTLLVRPTPDTKICAVGAITIDGRTIDLGEPMCL
ncbi:MAG: hypothetical protein DI573_04980 [Microbacterium sp.]|uniref:DUF2690 domain-containing protein n=1 Tax=Microbacterium sp. TaxID=51671 RepID=UPI000DB6CECB|nr:DUF2690 domain-containing protein [Microbacterium sp.]PZU40130.1 MAG: hypothetical protein DI573_04980 [Microbacterium sp.]